MSKEKEPKDKKDKDNIPKSLKSLFDPDSVDESYQDQREEKKISGVPFKSLFIPEKKKKLKDESDEIDDSLIESSSKKKKSKVQEDVEYGYDQTIFGSFKEVVGDQARSIIQQYKEKGLSGAKRGITEIEEPSKFNELKKKYLKITDYISEQHYFDPVLFLLVIMGSITAIIAIGIDIISDIINFTRIWMLYHFTSDFITGYIFWVIYSCIFMVLALFFTHYISPAASGPGIPELKCILSGVTLGNFLTFRTLIAKILGLLCTFLSNFVIGQEGPIVHIASCITEIMSKLNCFKKIRKNQNIRSQVLAAACAVGVACTFSASVGGVLFSIEVTSIYYPIRNYWYAFVASVPAGILFRIIWNLYLGESLLRPFVPMHFGDQHPEWYEWLIFIGISILGSILGIIIIKMNKVIVSFRRKYGSKCPLLGPFPYTIIVGIITALLIYPNLIGNFITYGNTMTLIDLYGKGDLLGLEKNSDWGTNNNVILNLFLFLIIRYVLAVFSTSIALPGGIFAPMLVQGAALGRIFGEIARMYFPKYVSPGIYAIVGATACASSTTQTISTAMIMFETTGDITSAYVVLFVVIISVGFSKIFTPNLYDSIIVLKRLPYLPNIKPEMEDIIASDLMEKDIPCIPLKTSIRQIKRVIEIYQKSYPHSVDINIPIVDNLKNKILIGATSLESLKRFSFKLEKEIIREEKLLDSKTISTLLPGEYDVKKLRRELLKLKFDIRPRLKELIKETPVQFLPNETLQVIHIHFSTMKLSNAFVVKNGKLKGVIQRSSFVQALAEHKDRIKNP